MSRLKMARGIKLPLIGGGVLVLLWSGIGAATVMGLADQPRELPAWREAFANVIIWIVMAYVPVYVAMLITSLLLKWKKKEVTAFRVSLIPFSVPLTLVVLLAAYYLIPGQR